MLSTPDVRITKTPGLFSSDPSTNDTIELFPIDIVPELQGAMLVVHKDYLALLNMLCTTPSSHEVGKRRIRRAVAAAAEGWSPAEYAALSEDGKDQVVRKVLGDRQPNDGQWPSLLFYLGDGMAGTAGTPGMSPSVSEEMKSSESAADNLTTSEEWWDQCWNNDSLRWPTDFTWTSRCSSTHHRYLCLCGGYAVHLTKHQIDQQDPIRMHARIQILHELVYQLRSFPHGVSSNSSTPKKCIDGSGIEEGGHYFGQIAFGCVVYLYSGISRSCLLTKDHDTQNQSVYEISNRLLKYLLTDERPPIVLPSQGGPTMPLFQHPPPSSFPPIRHQNSFIFSTTNDTIPISPTPHTPSLQNTATHNGLIPITGEFLERVQEFYKRREGFRCVQRSRR